jgi:hypothetical protein
VFVPFSTLLLHKTLESVSMEAEEGLARPMPQQGRALERACDRLAALLERASARRPYLHLERYMERFWVFRTRWLSARLHRILRSDHDRDLHDHPWPYATLILRGGYWEITEQGQRWHGPGSVLFRRATHLHRLVLPPDEPATTLFLHGRKRREWGFRTTAGWVHWRAYLAERGEDLV